MGDSQYALVQLTNYYKCFQRLYEAAASQIRLSEVRQQTVPDSSRSSCTEGSVAEVGARPTDEKRSSVRAERSLLW